MSEWDNSKMSQTTEGEERNLLIIKFSRNGFAAHFFKMYFLLIVTRILLTSIT